MSDILLEPPLLAAPTPTDVHPDTDPLGPRELRTTLLLAVGGVGALSAVCAAVGSPGLAATVAIAPLQIGVHLTFLTVPGLLVLRSATGLGTDLAHVTGALVDGLRHGVALLAATLPVVLFFAASMPHRLVVIALVFVAAELSLLAALARAWRVLSDHDEIDDLRPALVAAVWAVAAAAVSLLCTAGVYRALLEA